MFADNTFGLQEPGSARRSSADRPASYVGRVGALAVALGVGSAILGFTGVADASTGTGDSVGAAGQEAGPAGQSGPASGKARTTRRGPGSAAAAAPAASTDSSAPVRRSAASKPESATSGSGSSGAAVPEVPDVQSPPTTTPADDVALPTVVAPAAAVAPATATGSAPAQAPSGNSQIAPVVAAVAPAAAEAPVITAAEGGVLSEGPTDPSSGISGDGSSDPAVEPLAWATLAAVRPGGLAGPAPEVVPQADVSSGEPVDPLLAGDAPVPMVMDQVAVDTFPNPPLPVQPIRCNGANGIAVCTTASSTRGAIQTQLANAIVNALPSSGPTNGACSNSTCPVSPANYIAAYAFNTLYALTGGLNTSQVGGTIQQLFAQPNILTYVSQAVAGVPALANVPPAVAQTIGNAVGTFIQTSLGNPANSNQVAVAFAPFLQALNLPTAPAQFVPFGAGLANPDTAGATLLSSGTPNTSNYRAYSPTGMQTALINFFSNPAIQGALGATPTTPGAFSNAIDVLLGTKSATWAGAPVVPNTALADFLGGSVAALVLGIDDPNTPALAATIGGSVATLFSSIGDTVSLDAGNAFVTLLNGPVVIPPDYVGPPIPNVPTLLANDIVNGLVKTLLGANITPEQIPFPGQPAPGPALSQAAGLAINGFVSSVLSDPAVLQGLGAFVNEVVPGVLANPGIQELISGGVTNALTGVLGPQLGAAVSPAISAAVVNLLDDPAISGALTTFVNTTFGTFLTSFGVVPTLSDAAGTLTAAALDGTILTVGPQVIKAVRQSPFIDDGVSAGVGGATTQLLSDTAAGQVLVATIAGLTVELTGDPAVQQALVPVVASVVAGLLGDSPIAVPVGQAVGVAVQEFLATPGVPAALGVIAGSVLPVFLGSPGVPDAIGPVIGDLAAAVVYGTKPSEAALAALAALQSDPVIQSAEKATVGTGLGLVDSLLLSVPVVQDSLGSITSTLITSLAGDATVQQYAADQFGQPVANLLADTAAINAIAAELGSTVTAFLGYPGASTSLTDALDEAANVLIDGAGLSAALSAGLDALQSNPAYVSAVNALVPAAVVTLLDDPTVRNAFGTLAKQEVQTRFKSKLIGGLAGQVVGGTVDALLTKPAAIRLVNSLAVDALVGTLPADVQSYVIDQVVHSPSLQVAVGMSIGAGIGSLFGDNIVGRLIGLAAGIPATLLVGLAAGIVRIYEWLSGGHKAQSAHAEQALAAAALYFQPSAAPSDLFALNAVVPAAAAADGPFSLTGWTMSVPDAGRPGGLGIAMTIGSADSQPLRVSFNFRLDGGLLPA